MWEPLDGKIETVPFPEMRDCDQVTFKVTSNSKDSEIPKKKKVSRVPQIALADTERNSYVVHWVPS